MIDINGVERGNHLVMNMSYTSGLNHNYSPTTIYNNLNKNLNLDNNNLNNNNSLNLNSCLIQNGHIAQIMDYNNFLLLQQAYYNNNNAMTMAQNNKNKTVPLLFNHQKTHLPSINNIN